jgi:hypothetical protein
MLATLSVRVGDVLSFQNAGISLGAGSQAGGRLSGRRPVGPRAVTFFRSVTMNRRWNTLRLAGYGAVAGLVVEAPDTIPRWSLGSNSQAYALGELIGAAFAWAALVAAISGIRNRIVRAR